MRENSTWLRKTVCDRLHFLGLHLDEDRNAELRPDADLATDDSPGRILAIHTREDLMIARESRRLLRAGETGI